MNRTRCVAIILIALALICCCGIGGAALASTPEGTGHGGGGHGGPGLGEMLPLWSCIPFLGILLSIAIFPLVSPTFWHHNFGKVSAAWSVILAAPFLFAFRGHAFYEICHIYIVDYIPFILLLWALFTVSGGILLRGTLRGTPLVNTVMLTIGTLIASWLGTTGAAMLLIRPFIRANRHRSNKTFMIVFFIFLVCNIGGSLTPIGDPPLFLGFLHGVPFFWTMKILPHMMFCVVILLALYYALDWLAYRKEGRPVPEDQGQQKLRLDGSYNFIFLAGVIGSVLMSGILHLGSFTILGVHVEVASALRDMMMIVMGGLSLAFTPKKVREDNEFTWFPIKEVAFLFAGIFMTMIPCLLILKAGVNGALGFLIAAVKQPQHFFWITGSLSSFLDNAPTYLTFLNTALGRFSPGAPESVAMVDLLGNNAIYLKAISAGAVFMGANTYIGNAPNFMVRSIAEEAGIGMPSFFGYMIKYSMVILIPIFVVVTFVFF